MISPDGKNLYLTGAKHIWRLDRPMAAPEQLTSGSEFDRALDVTTDGKYLIMERGASDKESAGLYYMPAEGGELIKISHEPGVITTYVASAGDGQHVFFSTNNRELGSFALYQFDLQSRQRELLFGEVGDWFVADLMNDTWFLLRKSLGGQGNDYFEWNRLGGVLRPVAGPRKCGDCDVRFAREAGEYIVLSVAGGGKRSLSRLRGGKLEPISVCETAALVSLQTDLRHSRFYLLCDEAKRTFWEVREGTNLELLRLDSLLSADTIRIGKPTRFGRYVGILIEDANHKKNSHFIYDWKTTTLTQWTD